MEKFLFTLQQPVVAKYVIAQAIERVCQEIQIVSSSKKLTNLKLLSSHNLFNKSHSSDRQQRESLILTPIKEKLYTIFRDEKLIQERLEQILALLEDKTYLTVGYARENIQNLLGELKTDLHNLDISYS